MAVTENDAGGHFTRAKRVVVKVGSSVVSGAARHGAAMNLELLMADFFETASSGVELTVVSSGAVALGRSRLTELGEHLSGQQALSAIGQIDLMARWQSACHSNDRLAAQVLLSPDVTSRRGSYLNARAALRTLIAAKVIPIINENDAVATEELRYGDNDRLAAMAAGLVGADLLVLLTDIDGLYSANPSNDPDAMHIPFLPWNRLSEIERAGMSSGSQVGTGGMASKIDASILAGSWGIPVIIMDGRPERPFTSVIQEQTRASWIDASSKPARDRTKWLHGLAAGDAQITVDEGAVTALISGASLLAIGVTKIESEFRPGDIVGIKNADGVSIGFGLARLDSRDISSASSRSTRKTVIHRDDLMIEAQ